MFVNLFLFEYVLWTYRQLLDCFGLLKQNSDCVSVCENVCFYLYIWLLGISLSNDAEFNRRYAKWKDGNPKWKKRMQTCLDLCCPMAVQEFKTSPVAVQKIVGKNPGPVKWLPGKTSSSLLSLEYYLLSLEYYMSCFRPLCIMHFRKVLLLLISKR